MSNCRDTKQYGIMSKKKFPEAWYQASNVRYPDEKVGSQASTAGSQASTSGSQVSLRRASCLWTVEIAPNKP
jgi:hypothetical protein